MGIIIITAVVIFIISLFFSMFGKGGGEFYLPVLITFLGLPYYKAAGISLFLIFMQSASMVTVYSGKNRLVDWKLAVPLAIYIAFMAFLGGFISKSIPAIYLKTYFVAFLSLSAYFIYKEKSLISRRGECCKWHRRFYNNEYDVDLFLTFIPIGINEFLAGMTGISGGGLNVPIMIILSGIPMRIAMGTNTFLILASSSMAFVGHLMKGGIDLKLCLIFGTSIIFGSQIGSHLHAKLHITMLRIGFTIILILASLWMLIKIILP